MAGTPTWWGGFVRDVCKRWDGCEPGEFLAYSAVLVKGNPFVALYGYDILVRLDEFTSVRAQGKPMSRDLNEEDSALVARGWVLLTVPSSAAERFSEQWSRPAYEYVSAMPAKRRSKEEREARRKKAKQQAQKPIKRKATKKPSKKKTAGKRAVKKPTKRPSKRK